MNWIAVALLIPGVTAPISAHSALNHLPPVRPFCQRQIASSKENKVVRQELKKAYARYDQAVRKNNAAKLIEFLRANTLPSYSRQHNRATTTRPTIFAQLRDEGRRHDGRIYAKLLSLKTELGPISVSGSEAVANATQITVTVHPDIDGSAAGPGGMVEQELVKDRTTRRARDTWVKTSAGWKLRHTHILSVDSTATYITSPNYKPNR